MTAHLCADPDVCSAPPPQTGGHGRKVGAQNVFFPGLRTGIRAPTFNLLPEPLICEELPTQQNLTNVGLCVGVADVINHTKFGNDRSREYKVTEGRIVACSIGMACRL